MTTDRVLDGPIEPPAKPEMQRLFAIARIDSGARFLVESKPDERAALARRMGLVAIHALTCRFDLRRDDGDAIEARGMLRARVRQICVVSLDDFDADITEDFSVRFIPAGTESEALDPDSEDEIAYEGGVLDLGEAASEQLALALDPFPRKPGAELPGAATAPEISAFAALAKLLPRD
jgi:uncharacterized metal-binding protein YceD (DUF177 family)